MATSTVTKIDPETGWTEVWECEWGEGGWMLVCTYNAQNEAHDPGGI